MTDLVAFVRARLDEDAENWRGWLAEESPGPWEFLLAEVESKRQILDDHKKAFERRRQHPDDLASAGALLALHGAVRALAQPYSSHLDFREEWGSA